MPSAPHPTRRSPRNGAPARCEVHPRIAHPFKSIIASHLRKPFGAFTALDDVSVRFETGKPFDLLGPSGSGKTTLLRILAGLEIPDPHPRVAIRFGDREVATRPPGERGVGMVFQHYALFRQMALEDNIAFGLRARRVGERPTKADVEAKVAGLLDRLQ